MQYPLSWEDAFFAALERSDDVQLSAELAGLESRSVVYHHRARREDFRKRWDEARAAYRKALAKRAAYRAQHR